MTTTFYRFGLYDPLNENDEPSIFGLPMTLMQAKSERMRGFHAYLNEIAAERSNFVVALFQDTQPNAIEAAYEAGRQARLAGCFRILANASSEDEREAWLEGYDDQDRELRDAK